jgi:hypothetical protein
MVITGCIYWRVIDEIFERSEACNYFTAGYTDLVGSGITDTNDVPERYYVKAGLVKFGPVHSSTPSKNTCSISDP